MLMHLDKSSKKIALLIDPEKYIEQEYLHQKKKIESFFDIILVGGSSDQNNQIENCIHSLKSYFDLPLYIFPGSHDQISSKADGILYLSLISGDNPKYLIGEHRKSARKVKEMGIDVIPTGYILIDGSNTSAVELVSETRPLAQENVDAIIDTALAGELLGMQAIYLEAGSGAKVIVSQAIINRVNIKLDIPLIVGGGMRSTSDIKSAFENGANMVVIGTFIEESVQNIDQLKL